MVVERAIEIVHIHVSRHADLFFVGEAGGLAGLLARLGEDREENGRQQRDNGDDDQQLYQGEAGSIHTFPSWCVARA